MNGYRVDFLSPNGERAETWFSAPSASSGVRIGDELGLVALMFRMAHPGCVVLKATPCKLSEFKQD